MRLQQEKRDDSSHFSLQRRPLPCGRGGCLDAGSALYAVLYARCAVPYGTPPGDGIAATADMRHSFAPRLGPEVPPDHRVGHEED